MRQVAIAREQRGGELFVASDREDIYQTEAILRADVGAPATEDAFITVKDRADVAFQTA
jgi:hypothetical protein